MRSRRTAAALGKRYNIFPADTAVRPVDMFYKAIVEIGNILFRRKAKTVYRGDFNSSEKADFSAVFLLKLCQEAEVAAFFIADSIIVIRYAEHVDSVQWLSKSKAPDHLRRRQKNTYVNADPVS